MDDPMGESEGTMTSVETHSLQDWGIAGKPSMFAIQTHKHKAYTSKTNLKTTTKIYNRHQIYI